MDRFFLLSGGLEGDILHPIWFKMPQEVEAELGPGSYPVYTAGNFRYHWFLGFRPGGGTSSKLAQLWFYLRKGLQLHREKPFDCIVAYSHMTPGVMAAVLKLLTRTKLVIEIATTPWLLGITNRPKPNLTDRLKKLYSDFCLHVSAGVADRVHLLYPAQLSGYPLLNREGLAKKKASVFHEFILASNIPAATPCERDQESYIVQVGAPWYLKGVDRLVAAFKRLAPDFPNVKLKLVGWYDGSEKAGLEALRDGSPQIELVRALPNPNTLSIISRSLILVHPSRCEGGPSRVVTEGLVAGVPVVGSDVAGIPYAITDGENGFVVPGDDIDALERRLRELLSDPELRQRVGSKASVLAREQFSERVYVQQFTEMIRAAVLGDE